MSDSTRFVDGQVYLYSEIAERTLRPRLTALIPAGSMWLPSTALWQLARLIRWSTARRLRVRWRLCGRRACRIARSPGRAGVAFDSVQRASSGGGRVRQSTGARVDWSRRGARQVAQAAGGTGFTGGERAGANRL